jgi:GTP-binding protein
LALEVYENRQRRVPTAKLNEAMLAAVAAYHAPVVRGNSIKIKYVTQLPTPVPSFAFFTNYPDDIKTPLPQLSGEPAEDQVQFHRGTCTDLFP